MVAGAFLTSALGVSFGSTLFLITAIFAAGAVYWSLRAAASHPRRALAWRCWAAGHALAMTCSLLVVVDSIDGWSTDVGLRFGAAAAVAVVAGSVVFAWEAWQTARSVDVVDPLVVVSAAAAILIDLVVVPGLSSGVWLLTAIAVTDLVGLFAIGLATIGSMPFRAKAGMLMAMSCIVIGDSLAAAEAAGTVSLDLSMVALSWTAAAAMAAVAARAEIAGDTSEPRRPSRHPAAAAWARLLVPIGALTALPLAAVSHRLFDPAGLTAGTDAFYRGWFVVVAVIAFARQAGLLVERRRRTAELEALVDFATTMVRAGDEESMLECCTEKLKRVARASSVVVSAPSDTRPPARVAGHVLDLPLTVYDCTLGGLRVVRPPAAGAFSKSDAVLLGALADQLAIGLQTAYDRRARIESASRDPLTGLCNRRYFTEVFDKEARRYERSGSTTALVLFDVDNLKAINAVLGSESDSVLRRIAEVVEPHIRPSDLFARLGGGEYALLLPQTGQLEALLVAERIRTAISRTRLIANRQVTVSGGVASMPQDGTTRQELERSAGVALAWAKRNGRNLCAVAREAASGAAPNRVEDDMLAHLHAVVAGIDSVHLHTRDHSENVAAYAVAIAQELGLDEGRIVQLRRAAFLHDIGKIAVPTAILSKPDQLTKDEYEQIKIHPAVGGNMLAHAGLHDEARWVRHHHERVDGTGYPGGVLCDELELESRIIFVADSFEAMTSDRPYRRGMSVEDAVAELCRCAGTQFDPEVVMVMRRLLEHDRLYVMSLKDVPVV